MRFQETRLPGVWLIDVERIVDERGFFGRAWCAEEFTQRGLTAQLAQCNIAFSHRQGTLRGIHFQHPPHAEDKLVRCTRGSAFVVAVDLREESPRCGEWIGVELSATNRRMLYVPQRCGQGYQTLEHDTELFYQMSEFYHSELSDGFRYDDPAWNISWPLPVSVISQRDRQWPDYPEKKASPPIQELPAP